METRKKENIDIERQRDDKESEQDADDNVMCYGGKVEGNKEQAER